MWIFTRDGFFSVVNDYDCKENELMVRARNSDDLHRFLDHVSGTSRAEIIEMDHADYRYRVKLPRTAVIGYMVVELDSLRYPNFKATIDYKDTERSIAYHEIWNAMYAFQQHQGQT